MPETVGVRELRQNLSKYLDRVKAGEDLVVTEHGQVVAKVVPAGTSADVYAELAARFDTSALGRVLLGEPDAPAILRDLGGFGRLPAGLALLPLDEALLAAAETVPPSTAASTPSTS